MLRHISVCHIQLIGQPLLLFIMMNNVVMSTWGHSCWVKSWMVNVNIKIPSSYRCLLWLWVRNGPIWLGCTPILPLPEKNSTRGWRWQKCLCAGHVCFFFLRSNRRKVIPLDRKPMCCIYVCACVRVYIYIYICILFACCNTSWIAKPEKNPFSFRAILQLTQEVQGLTSLTDGDGVWLAVVTSNWTNHEYESMWRSSKECFCTLRGDYLPSWWLAHPLPSFACRHSCMIFAYFLLVCLEDWLFLGREYCPRATSNPHLTLNTCLYCLAHLTTIILLVAQIMNAFLAYLAFCLIKLFWHLATWWHGRLLRFNLETRSFMLVSWSSLDGSDRWRREHPWGSDIFEHVWRMCVQWTRK